MKILMAGDTHGSVVSVTNKIDAAKRLGIQRIVVLGDFGLWWGHEGLVFLDEINRYASDNNVQIFGIGGNHECWELWDMMIAGARVAQQTSHGWAYIRTNVLLSPKVHAFTWGKKNFVVAGGAVSIDKQWRLEYYAHKGKKVWSPNEQLTDDDVDNVINLHLKQQQRVDYLLTHDCSDRTPWKHRLKPDIDSKIHRQRIDRVLKEIKPKMHFHGHMHERYDWENRIEGDKYVSTFGLECNDDPDSWGVLDLATDEFTFATDL